MDKVAEVKVQFNKEKWFNLIKERQNSGLTIKKWCNQNNIREHTYYYWLRRIRMSACTEYMGAAQNEPKSPVAFAPLQINEKVDPEQAPIIIHMQNADIEVRDGSSLHALETVLTVLKNIC